MFEKFTERARKVMSLSRQEAQNRNNEFISTEHALLAILQEGGGVASKVLAKLGITLKNAREAIDKIEPPPKQPSSLLGQIPFSPRMKRVIELAGETASQASADVIGTEHLLLGLFLEGDGIAAKVLGSFEVTEERLRKEMRDVLGSEADRVTPYLDRVLQAMGKTSLPVPFEGIRKISPPRRIKVRLFTVSEAAPKESYLVVGDVKYSHKQTLILEGISAEEQETVVKGIAGNLDCQIYTIELLTRWER